VRRKSSLVGLKIRKWRPVAGSSEYASLPGPPVHVLTLVPGR